MIFLVTLMKNYELQLPIFEFMSMKGCNILSSLCFKKFFFHFRFREVSFLDNLKLNNYQQIDLIHVYKQQMVLVTKKIWDDHALVDQFQYSA